MNIYQKREMRKNKKCQSEPSPVTTNINWDIHALGKPLPNPYK